MKHKRCSWLMLFTLSANNDWHNRWAHVLLVIHQKRPLLLHDFMINVLTNRSLSVFSLSKDFWITFCQISMKKEQVIFVRFDAITYEIKLSTKPHTARKSRLSWRHKGLDAPKVVTGWIQSREQRAIRRPHSSSGFHIEGAVNQNTSPIVVRVRSWCHMYINYKRDALCDSAGKCVNLAARDRTMRPDLIF